MVGPATTDRRWIWLLLAALPLGLTAGCASKGDPEPRSLPPQSISQAESLDPPPESEPPVEAPVKDDTMVVIEEGLDTSRPRTLAAAAEAEQERRRDSGESVIVITDDNLEDYATGSLTIASEPAVTVGEGGDDPLLAEAEAEEFWREQVLQARLRWRDAVDRSAELESDIAELRRRFYAEDDPFYRDSQIKPAWDRALEELDDSRAEGVAAQEDLEQTLEEGRRAGALPGWLREGIEFEPLPEESEGDDSTNPAEPREPVTVEEGASR